MNVDTSNPLIEKEIGINVQCLKDNIKTYFRCIITQNAFDRFYKELKSVGNVKFEKALSNISIRQSQSNNQSTFRKAITKEWDRAHIRDRSVLVIQRRGAFKWLPVLCENDLVHGSWWFVVGSIYIVIAGGVVLANNYNASILGEDDDGTGLDNFTFRASWILVIFMGIFFTLGSLAFVRATHFDPPMKPLFTWYHLSTDELLASWLFFLGTIPAIPYVLLFLRYAGHVYTKIILVIALLMSFLFVYAVLLFVFSCYPTADSIDGARPHRVLNMTTVFCKCFCSEKFLRKHLVNDWLAGCWLFLWATVIAMFGMLYLFFTALYQDQEITQFIMGTGWTDSFIFAIGSAYFVAGSYPEYSDSTDMLTASLTAQHLNRIDEDM